jgi:hypothetical protein
MLKGSCLCGAITWETTSKPRGSVSCHCSQCRKTSGHYWSATQVPTAELTIRGKGLTWFQSSDTARRGFCGRCGASLFWEKAGEEATSIASGSIDGPSGIKEEKHIYCRDKGDYYDLPDGVPLLR